MNPDIEDKTNPIKGTALALPLGGCGGLDWPVVNYLSSP